MRPGGIAQQMAKRFAGIHRKRTLPEIASSNLRNRLSERDPIRRNKDKSKGKVLLFIDEFTNWIDVGVGLATVELLERLGYEVNTIQHSESGRSAISLGLIGRAKEFAEANVRCLAPQISEQCKLVGIEPSALLTLRDEYADLVSSQYIDQANHLANHSLLVEEFLFAEWRRGQFDGNEFRSPGPNVLLHQHCHEKSLTQYERTETLLVELANATVTTIDSGCCGMAGSFGYSNANFELSNQIGQLSLFPAIESAGPATTMVASGISCRHQIADATGRVAVAPVQLLAHCMSV